jgi:hypothetical protein
MKWCSVPLAQQITAELVTIKLMEREDYLLRMIAQMGLVLARARRMLFRGKNAEAGADLELAAVTGGIDLGLVIALDEASLRPLLLTGGDFDRPKCAFFAEVVYLEWRRQLSMRDKDSADRCARRALQLFSLAYEGIVMDEDTRQHVAELQGRIEPAALHDDAPGWNDEDSPIH